MKTIKKIFPDLLVYIAIIIDCILTSNILFISNSNNFSSATYVLGYIFGAIILFLSIFYLFCIIKNKKILLDTILYPFVLIFLIAGIIAIFSNSENICVINYSINFTNNITIPLESKFLFGFVFIVQILLFICLVNLIFIKKSLKKVFQYTIYVYLCFMLLVLIFSLFYDMGSLINLFSNSTFTPIKSFFPNNNVFGLFLFIAIFLIMLIDIKKQSFINKIGIILFLIFIYFSQASIIVFISMIFVACYFIYSFIKKMFVSPFKGCFYLCVSLVIIATLISLCIFTNNKGIVFFDNLFLPIRLLISNNVFSQFYDNFNNVTRCFGAVNNSTLSCIVGKGYGLSQYIFGILVNGNIGAYNLNCAWFNCYANYGFFGVGLFLLIYVYCVYCIINLIKRKKTEKEIFYLIFFISFLAIGFFIDNVNPSLNLYSLPFTIFILLPPIITYKRQKLNQESTNYEKDE